MELIDIKETNQKNIYLYQLKLPILMIFLVTEEMFYAHHCLHSVYKTGL